MERRSAPSPSAAGRGGALAALDFAGVRGETVLCPSNTFMATPLAIDARGRARSVRRLQPRRPLHVVRGLRAQGRASTGRARRSSSTSAATSPSRSSGSPSYCRERRDLPARGLRPRPRRRAGTVGGRALGRRRRLLLLRDQDRSPPARAACSSRANEDLLEHARAFRNYGKPDHAVAGPQLPDQRVHRRDRPRADRAARGDRRPEERGRARAARPASTRRGSSCPTG